MAKTIFAGKNVEKFSFNKFVAVFRTVYTKFSCLPKNFFFGNRPGDACNGQCHNKKVINVCFHKQSDPGISTTSKAGKCLTG